MKALVTGGSGFVGTHLVAGLIAQGIETRAPSSKSWDLRREPQAREQLSWKPDLLFHLAAISSPLTAAEAPREVVAVNVEGTGHLLAATAELAPACKVVLVSTCHVYGKPRTLPIREEHPLGGQGCYAESKIQGEALARRYRKRLDICVARPFHLTGPGQPLQYAPANWARQVAEGKREITVGDVSLVRDYMDVRDAVDGLLILAHRSRAGEVYNLCRGEGVPLSWILNQLVGSVPLRQDPARMRPHDIPRMVGDPTRARDLGWQPRRELETSLAELLDYSRTSI